MQVLHQEGNYRLQGFLRTQAVYDGEGKNHAAEDHGNLRKAPARARARDQTRPDAGASALCDAVEEVREDRFGTAGVRGGDAGRHEMQRTSSRGEILEIIVFAIASFLLGSLETWAFFSFIPLQMIYMRRGQRALILSSALSFVLLMFVGAYYFIFRSDRDAVSALQYAAQLVPVLSLLAGIIVINLKALCMVRATVRLIFGSLVSGLCTLILYLGAMLFTEFPNAVLAFFTEISNNVRNLFAILDVELISSLAAFLEPTALMERVIFYMLRGYTFMYFLMLSFSWFVGGALASRMYFPGQGAIRPRLSAFRLENWFLWPLIAAGALILLDKLIPIAIISAISWNIGLIFMFLFGIQGLAIVKFVFEKHRLPRIIWTLFMAMICIMLIRTFWTLVLTGMKIMPFSADLNIVLIIAIPAFGVSENWIRYRIPWDPKADDFGKE